MTFLNMEPAKRIVPGEGPLNSPIMIVGEAPGAFEDQSLRPFVGPAGGVLEQCLHAAGLVRGDIRITNVIKTRPRGNKIEPYFNSTTGTFTAEGMKHVEALRNEIAESQPNVIIACGSTAMAALTCSGNRGLKSIMKLRGYFLESLGLDRTYKVLPTIHPSAALRGNYIYRYIISTDLKKAKLERASPELVRPERKLIYHFSNVLEAVDWLDFYSHEPVVSCDIEVLNYELACIGFSSDPTVACSIPVAQRWTLQDELLIWRGIQRVLANGESTKVFQNGIFDIHFLLTRCGIETKGPLHDTMIAHSVMYPELKKSLEFLGSVYCGTQAYWKDMAKFTNIKGEA